MSASRRLLRLYPRAWRERYGEEFLATVGVGALRLHQKINIVSGAIDAWLSADVRQATRAGRLAPNERGNVMPRSLLACRQTQSNYTVRDSLIGAGVLIAASVVFLGLGIIARRNGWPVAGEILKGFAFPGSVALSLPFTFLKGQPWKAQLVLVGGVLAILATASVLSVFI